MNNISKQRIEFTKQNFKKFKNPNIAAAIVTGSIGKGYGDDNSDIDTIIFYKKPFTRKEYNKLSEKQS
jgi:predicted nucleotidyltransferase